MLKDAFLELLEEKTFDKIAATELCNLAGLTDELIKELIEQNSNPNKKPVQPPTNNDIMSRNGLIEPNNNESTQNGRTKNNLNVENIIIEAENHTNNKVQKKSCGC